MGNKGCYVIKADSSITPKTFVLQGYQLTMDRIILPCATVSVIPIAAAIAVTVHIYNGTIVTSVLSAYFRGNICKT